MEVTREKFVEHSEKRIKEIQKDMLQNFWTYDVIKMQALEAKIRRIKKTIAFSKIQIDQRFFIPKFSRE